MPVLRQLPCWAWIGGGVLALIAGIVNAAGVWVSAISRSPTSPVLLGVSLGAGDGGEAMPH